MKKKRIKRAPFCGICLALSLLLLLFSAGCRRGSDQPLSPGLSLIAGEPIYEDDVAVRSDNFVVTPGMMAYFFYTYGANMMVQMEQEKAFDDSKSLHDQMFTETQSWYDVMMNETLAKVSELLIYCEAGAAEGVKLDATVQQAIADEMAAYRLEAAAQHGVELDTYLQRLYGPLMRTEDLQLVLELESFANRFSLMLQQRLEQGITGEQAVEYAERNGLSDATPSRNISFLFIPHENGEVAQGKVVQALSALKQAPTAECMQTLSALGSYGEQGNMTPANSGIAPLTDWLFASGRRVGDYGSVEVGGATYVLLYTGNGISYGEVAARMALFDSAYAEWYNGWVARIHFGYNYDCLDGYDKKQ